MSLRKIISVDYIDQTKDYPTGCESVSTVMCLNYHKIDISVDDFIKKYLDMGEFYLKEKTLYAPDPNINFVGSPYDKYSFGCFESVNEKALNKIIKEKNLQDIFEIKNLNGISMEDIIKNYIDKDCPVIFWATIDLKPMYNGRKWIIIDTEKEFTWPAREHCLLLVGYDYNEKKYYFNDPWNNNGCIGYEMSLVEQRHKELFSMAVAIVKKSKC